MEGITRDYVILICQHLEPIDIARWSLAQWRLAPQLRELFYERLKQKIDNLFRQYFDVTEGTYSKKVEDIFGTDSKSAPPHPTKGSYYDFVGAMMASRGVVSGSFILQMITGQKFEGTDIDIYSDMCSSLLWPTAYPYMDCNDLEIVLWTDHDENYSANGYVGTNLMHIREYYIKEGPLKDFVKFQVITLRVEPVKFIRTNFDLDILKNGFWYDDEGNPQIMVGNLPAILSGKCVFNKEKYYRDSYWAHPSKVEGRIEKYRERGFDIIVL